MWEEFLAVGGVLNSGQHCKVRKKSGRSYVWEELPMCICGRS